MARVVRAAKVDWVAKGGQGELGRRCGIGAALRRALRRSEATPSSANLVKAAKRYRAGMGGNSAAGASLHPGSKGGEGCDGGSKRCPPRKWVSFFTQPSPAL